MAERTNQAADLASREDEPPPNANSRLMNRSDLTWKQSPGSRVIWTSADRDTAAAKHEGAEVAAYRLVGFAVPDASISPDGSLEGITNFQVADRAGRERDIALLTSVAAPEDGLDPDWPPTWENFESAFRPDSTHGGDHRDLVQSVERLGLDESEYNSLVADAHVLVVQPEFHALRQRVTKHLFTNATPSPPKTSPPSKARSRHSTTTSKLSKANVTNSACRATPPSTMSSHACDERR
jgi:hypothetical protein